MFLIFCCIPSPFGAVEREQAHQEVLKKLPEKSLNPKEYNLLEDFEKKVFLENGGVVR